ncbi:MAG: DUF1987 domain-containing protein [Bacteroidetes bacterium]|nr:DUF1987 domain-containing protein [Bacteroidota bacterium]
MKNSLIIEETNDTPKIILDKLNGVFEISGRSLPENAVKFYSPVLKWMEEYIVTPNQATHFEFKLDYFNSASTKKLFEVITILEKLSSNSLPVTVIWYHTKDDELIRNRGLEIKEMVELPFEVKMY